MAEPEPEFDTVSIEVRGRAGIGKSTISLIVLNALLAEGFMVRSTRDDPPDFADNHDQRVEQLRHRVLVSIVDVQLPRGAVMAV